MRTFACAHAHKQTLEEEAVRFAEDASVTPDCGVAAVMLISGVWRREPEMKAHSRMRHALGGDRGWWEAGDGRGGRSKQHKTGSTHFCVLNQMRGLFVGFVRGASAAHNLPARPVPQLGCERPLGGSLFASCTTVKRRSRMEEDSLFNHTRQTENKTGKATCFVGRRRISASWLCSSDAAPTAFFGFFRSLMVAQSKKEKKKKRKRASKNQERVVITVAWFGVWMEQSQVKIQAAMTFDNLRMFLPISLLQPRK